MKPKTLPVIVAEAERAYILDALMRNAHNRTHTAKELGISRRTLLYKIEEHRLGKLSKPLH